MYVCTLSTIYGPVAQWLKNSSIKCCRMILIGCNCLITTKVFPTFSSLFRHPLVLLFIRKVLKNVEIETNKCMQLP